LWLRLHFGMTGSLLYFKYEEDAGRHTRVFFVFANAHRLAFDDQRKFGEVGLVEDVDEYLRKRGVGPDALYISLSQFRKTLRNHRWTHFMVLRALPETSRNTDRRSVRLAELYSAALIQRVANPQGAQAQCLCSVTPVGTRTR